MYSITRHHSNAIQHNWGYIHRWGAPTCPCTLAVGRSLRVWMFGRAVARGPTSRTTESDLAIPDSFPTALQAVVSEPLLAKLAK